MEISTDKPSSRPHFRLPQLAISDGTIEALKWLALALMTFDHVDKYLMHEGMPVLFDAGRLAMPLFATIFGFNMARPRGDSHPHYVRTIGTLLASWACATPACIALGGLAWGWWPLNVMAMFACTAAVMWLVDSGRRGSLIAACLVFALTGAFVEYWWPGMVLALAAWRYVKRPSWTALALWLASALALYLINRNWWALAAIPVLFLATRVQLTVPRQRLLFYVYYPAHLWLLLLVLHLAA